MSRLVVGCGYLGLRVARLWRDAGEHVFAVTRSARRADDLAAEGLDPLVADIMCPDTLGGLPTAETVLFAVGLDRASGWTIGEFYVGGLQNVLAALPAGTGRLIYISTTGVYGQTDGSWIDESSSCEPARDSGRAFVAAEQALTSHPLGRQSVILRLAGIYGPDRIPLAGMLKAGQSLPVPDGGHLNLIHVDDAAAAVLAAERIAPLPGLYCVADGNPAPRGEYYSELARLLDAPPPRFELPEKNSPKASRAATNKLVRNARMLTELRVTLRYPSFREGLAAIVRAEEA